MNLKQVFKDAHLIQSLLSMFLKIAQIGGGFIIILILTNSVSQTLVGQYSQYLSFLAVFGLPVSSGIANYFIREFSSNWDELKNRKVLFSEFLRLVIVLSPVSGLLLSVYFYHEFEGQIWWVYAIAGMPIIFIGLNTVRSSVLKVENKFFAADMPEMLIRPMLLGGLLLLIINTVEKIDIQNLIFIEVFCYLLMFLVGILVLKLAGFGYLNQLPSHEGIKTMSNHVKDALPFMLLGGLQVISANIDIIILAELSTLENVAIYKVIFMMNKILLFLAVTVYTVISPNLPKLFLDRDLEQIQKLVRKANRLTIAVVGPVFLLFFFFAGDILAMAFGSDYAVGETGLQIFAIGFLCITLSGPAGNLLIMSGNERKMLTNRFFFLMSNIVLDIVLIPKFGIYGAIYSTVIVLIGASVVLSVYVKRKIGLRSDIFYSFMKNS